MSMRTFFYTVIGAAVLAVATLWADTIARPPTLEWDPVTKYSDGRNIETNTVVKYNVYRATGNDTNRVKIATVTTTSYADTNAILAMVYTYWVAGELWGLEAEPSPGLVFMTYAPAPLPAAPKLKP